MSIGLALPALVGVSGVANASADPEPNAYQSIGSISCNYGQYARSKAKIARIATAAKGEAYFTQTHAGDTRSQARFTFTNTQSTWYQWGYGWRAIDSSGITYYNATVTAHALTCS
jgi:hypothetical protein